MDNPLNFAEINHAINSPQWRVDIAEMEGCLLGLLSTSNFVELNYWLSYFDLDKIVLAKKQLALLKELHQYYQNYDWHNEYCPEFLFSQSLKLNEKVTGLKQFASGFLFALGMKPSQFKKLTNQCREFVEHLVDFSQLSTEGDVLEDSDELDFQELYEFTRAGVSLMMVENPAPLDPKAKITPSYHPSQQIH